MCTDKTGTDEAHGRRQGCCGEQGGSGSGCPCRCDGKRCLPFLGVLLLAVAVPMIVKKVNGSRKG